MKLRFPRDIPSGAAAAVVALALLAGAVTGREDAHVPPASQAKNPSDYQPTRPAETAVPQERLDLDKLERRRKELSIADPFANGSTVPSVPVAAPPAPVVVAPPPPPAAPIAPPLPFTFLGRMKNGERAIVYLLRNQEMLIVEAGQAVGHDYRVESITQAAVNFVYLPLGTAQMLSLPQQN